MYFQISDSRIPLKPGDVVVTASGSRIVIDRYAGSGGFSLMYIAHHEGSSRYVALIVWMPEDVGNEANYMRGSVVPRVELGITVFAQQAGAPLEP